MLGSIMHFERPLSESGAPYYPSHRNFEDSRDGYSGAMGALTVGQSVLEGVDAVQNDGTWKGD